jgi:hypothetical protein
MLRENCLEFGLLEYVQVLGKVIPYHSRHPSVIKVVPES